MLKYRFAAMVCAHALLPSPNLLRSWLPICHIPTCCPLRARGSNRLSHHAIFNAGKHNLPLKIWQIIQPRFLVVPGGGGSLRFAAATMWGGAGLYAAFVVVGWVLVLQLVISMVAITIFVCCIVFIGSVYWFGSRALFCGVLRLTV